MIKVLLVADLEQWILGQVALQLSQRLSNYMQVTVLYSRSPGFLASFETLQRRNDVVHFLSSTDVIDSGDITYIPCVATLWHMVNWAPFEECAGRIDALFVCSQQWQQRVVEHIPTNLAVRRMYFGLDIARFVRDHSAKPAFLQQAGLDQNVLVFGFAGSGWSNEGNRKGLDRLWDCFIQLKHASGISFELRIIGPYWPKNIVPSELRPQTHFDIIDTSLLPQYYSSLDYYVCTSRIEGGPYPVLEAMSCECVVLSTPVGIVPEILCHEENGFLLRDNSITADFLDAMGQTATHPDRRRRCGQNARQTVVERCSWNTAVNPDEFLEMYELAIRFFESRPRRQHRTLYRASVMRTKYRQARLILKPRDRLRRVWQILDQLR